jgi:signal peptide peptidase SppA
MTLIDLLTGPWAIAPDKLLELQAIYATHFRGDKIDLPALEARLGRPLAHEQQDYRIEPGGVAVLSLSGVMAPKANLFSAVSGGISTQKATVQLESAVADPRVKSIVLHLDSPGGNVLGTPEFGAAIYQLSQEKPIVAYSDGMLCSAAYWAGSAACAVYISGPVVQVGSIGVVHSRTYNPTTPVVEENITAGKYKRLSTGREPYSPEARAVVQADVDYLYSLFVDTVAQYRSTTTEQVLAHMADGRVFRGQHLHVQHRGWVCGLHRHRGHLRHIRRAARGLPRLARRPRLCPQRQQNHRARHHRGRCRHLLRRRASECSGQPGRHQRQGGGHLQPARPQRPHRNHGHRPKARRPAPAHAGQHAAPG